MTDLFVVITEVGVTIAGFAGLFVAFAARHRQITDRERYALLFLLFSSLGAALLAILPSVIDAFWNPPSFAPWYCAMSATVMVAIGVFSHTGRSDLSTAARYPLVRRIMMPLHWLVAAGQTLPLADVDPYAVYALALWWLITIALFQFVMQIASVTRSD